MERNEPLKATFEKKDQRYVAFGEATRLLGEQLEEVEKGMKGHVGTQSSAASALQTLEPSASSPTSSIVPSHRMERSEAIKEILEKEARNLESQKKFIDILNTELLNLEKFLSKQAASTQGGPETTHTDKFDASIRQHEEPSASHAKDEDGQVNYKCKLSDVLPETAEKLQKLGKFFGFSIDKHTQFEIAPYRGAPNARLVFNNVTPSQIDVGEISNRSINYDFFRGEKEKDAFPGVTLVSAKALQKDEQGRVSEFSATLTYKDKTRASEEIKLNTRDRDPRTQVLAAHFAPSSQWLFNNSVQEVLYNTYSKHFTPVVDEKAREASQRLNPDNRPSGASLQGPSLDQQAGYHLPNIQRATGVTTERRGVESVYKGKHRAESLASDSSQLTLKPGAVDERPAARRGNLPGTLEREAVPQPGEKWRENLAGVGAVRDIREAQNLTSRTALREAYREWSQGSNPIAHPEDFALQNPEIPDAVQKQIADFFNDIEESTLEREAIPPSAERWREDLAGMGEAISGSQGWASNLLPLSVPEAPRGSGRDLLDTQNLTVLRKAYERLQDSNFPARLEDSPLRDLRSRNVVQKQIADFVSDVEVAARQEEKGREPHTLALRPGRDSRKKADDAREASPVSPNDPELLRKARAEKKPDREGREGSSRA